MLIFYGLICRFNDTKFNAKTLIVNCPDRFVPTCKTPLIFGRQINQPVDYRLNLFYFTPFYLFLQLLAGRYGIVAGLWVQRADNKKPDTQTHDDRTQRKSLAQLKKVHHQTGQHGTHKHPQAVAHG